MLIFLMEILPRTEVGWRQGVALARPTPARAQLSKDTTR